MDRRGQRALSMYRHQGVLGPVGSSSRGCHALPLHAVQTPCRHWPLGEILSEYFSELCRSMALLAEQPNAMFVGQGVGCAGTTMTDTLKDVPKEKLLEFPVAEDLQMGMAIGMALEGVLPVCIFPR